MERDDWRKPASRVFGVLALVVMVWWGSKIFQDVMPVESSVRYDYEGLPHATELVSVRARVLDQKQQVLARVTYYHHGGLAAGASGVVRQQALRLPQGEYQLDVWLSYKQRPPLRLKKALRWRRGGGRFLLRLRDARPVR